MKLGFVTCVKLGLSCIEAIYESGAKLDVVITLKDELAQNKSGRVYVDEFCERKRIKLLKVRNINDNESLSLLNGIDIDWLFIIGWSQIARESVLKWPKYGVLGMHPTLLPEGRGRASIPWAILKGLKETGVTLFQMDEGVDSGPILAQVRIAIAPTETATVLYEKVNCAHADLIKKILPDLLKGTLLPVPQDASKATEWPGRKPDDGRIFPTMTVSEAERLVRATTHPYPGAFYINGDRLIRIWEGAASVEGQASMNSIRIPLTDGIYEALKYDIE